MPINPDACPGPCNNQARRAWDTYDQAIIRHGYEMELYVDAHQRWRHDFPVWQAAAAVWHAPLVWPVEPIEPREPDRPQQPGMPVPAANPTWCGRCPATIRSALYRVNELAPVLYADITGHRGAGITGPNGTKPLDPKTVIERLDEMYGDLATVASHWKQVRNHPDRPSPARGSDARNLVVGYLLEQLDNILRHPGSVEFGLCVLAWERRLVKLSRSEPVSRRSVIRCPRCRERQVIRRDDGYYECLCGRLLNQAEHDREKFEQADEHDHEQQEAHA